MHMESHSRTAGHVDTYDLLGGELSELNQKKVRDKLLLFADDVNCTIRRKTLEELKEAMVWTFLRIQTFCRQNRLKLNSGKSHFLVIISSQKRTYHDVNFDLDLGSATVRSSEEERVLGLQVGNSLGSWKYQIDHSSRSVIKNAQRN